MVNTSTHAVAEAVHKIMVAEAALRFQLSRQGLVNWLQRHADRIQDLRDFRTAAEEIALMTLNVLPADMTIFSEAAEVSAQFHLLTNDALIVAMMRRRKLTHLVTNDDDFDDITSIQVWKPR